MRFFNKCTIFFDGILEWTLVIYEQNFFLRPLERERVSFFRNQSLKDRNKLNHVERNTVIRDELFLSIVAGHSILGHVWSRINISSRWKLRSLRSTWYRVTIAWQVSLKGIRRFLCAAISMSGNHFENSRITSTIIIKSERQYNHSLFNVSIYVSNLFITVDVQFTRYVNLV